MDDTKPLNPRYVGILALAASVILAGGWLARPRAVPEAPAPLPSETELEQLARRSERRSLDSMTKYFEGVARDVDPSIARVRNGETSGIAWNDGRIVTPPLSLKQAPRTVTVAALSGEADALPIVWGPNLPLAALDVDLGRAGLTPVYRALSPPQAGDWIVAVWRTDAAPSFAVGNFRQITSSACGVTPVQEVASSVVLDVAMVGGGLFDIDGRLVAVILPCAGRIAGVAAASVQAILERANTVEQGVLGRYGLGLGPLTPEEGSYFKTTGGLLVRDVWTDHAGDVAGLRPGDIITAVNGAKVVTMDDAQAMTTPSDTPLQLTIRRGSKRMTIALAANAEEEGAGAAKVGAGLTMESSPRTYRIASVRPGSPAAQAGIHAGDRLIRIDQAAPRSLDQVNRIVGSDKPPSMWIEVERAGRRLGMLVRQ